MAVTETSGAEGHCYSLSLDVLTRLRILPQRLKQPPDAQVGGGAVCLGILFTLTGLYLKILYISGFPFSVSWKQRSIPCFLTPLPTGAVGL